MICLFCCKEFEESKYHKVCNQIEKDKLIHLEFYLKDQELQKDRKTIEPAYYIVQGSIEDYLFSINVFNKEIFIMKDNRKFTLPFTFEFNNNFLYYLEDSYKNYCLFNNLV